MSPDRFDLIVIGKASTVVLASAIVAYLTASEIAKAASFALQEAAVFGRWPKRWAAMLVGARRWRG